MPWSLIITAAVLIGLWALITRRSRKIETSQYASFVAAETSLMSMTKSIQNKHTAKFGRANTDLASIEESLPNSRS